MRIYSTGATIVVAALLLAGCAAKKPIEGLSAAQQRESDDRDTMCLLMGHKDGTQGHANCRAQLDAKLEEHRAHVKQHGAKPQPRRLAPAHPVAPAPSRPVT